MASSRSPTVAGVDQDVLGWQLVQLFYHVNTDGFRLLPWVCGSVRFAVTHQHLEVFLHHWIPEEEPLEKRSPNGKLCKQILIGQSCDLTDSHWSETEEI
jgi:hypothetical protein